MAAGYPFVVLGRPASAVSLVCHPDNHPLADTRNFIGNPPAASPARGCSPPKVPVYSVYVHLAWAAERARSSHRGNSHTGGFRGCS